MKEIEMYVPNKGIRPQTEWVASADVPTRHGVFTTHVFRTTTEDGDVKEHVALVHGSVEGREALPIRVHSECLTSEVFGSLKCDCKEQLDAAMAEVVHRGAGAILYLRQEGRGIGLANKIRAYALQAEGHDTVDANRLLGLPDDARKYDVARDMLTHLRVPSIVLLTNNPDKVAQLERLGVEVVRREPVHVKPNVHSASYLEAKRVRMDHLLPHWAHLQATGTDAE